MSLRAIKKRENQLTPSSTRPTLFRKATNSTTTTTNPSTTTSPTKHKTAKSGNHHKIKANSASATFSAFNNLQKQRNLLGRSIQSNPELRSLTYALDYIETEHIRVGLVHTKSEADLSELLKSCTGNAADTAGRGLIGAKSEICLQTISSHNYQTISSPSQKHRQSQLQHPLGCTTEKMISGARSHRDLTQSAYNNSSNTKDNMTISPARRRMSECSLASSAGYSQRTSAMSSSAMSSSAMTLGSSVVALDPNAVLRVPIIGYEVMEERARFTVYKLRVENPQTTDCWLVLRRYTDFVRLNTKLKQAFPHITLMLPRKKIFGDNFNSVFLDNRVQGLQIFVNSIMCNESLRKYKLVREFFCLDEPPTYSESMEECRAIFEAQEETIAHLKLQINNKNDLILNLQQKLREEMLEKEQLKETLKNMSSSSRCTNCTATNGGAATLK